jgi:hypothetical protein
MPTVDSHPQSPAHIQMYGEADRVATYSAYGKDILEKQSNGLIKVSDMLRPGFDKDNFYPIKNKEELKQRLRLTIDNDAFIIGTVMRNQKRKLYDDLFLSFRKLLDDGTQNTYLYCHTSYPDQGYDIPRLLRAHKIANRVLFTYVCRKCRSVLPAFFSDVNRVCPHCGGPMVFPQTQIGATNKQLGEVYNLFDVYVQYAIAEGAGMPSVEASGCGVHVMEVDFSAMEDYVRCLKGTPIPVQRLFREPETHYCRAYPDNDKFVEQLKELIPKVDNSYEARQQRNKQAISIFNWDDVAVKWEKNIDSLQIEQSLWRAVPPFIHQPRQVDERMPNSMFVPQAIMNITGRPDLIHTFTGQRMLKNLNYGAKITGFGGLSYNDESFFGQQFKHKEYNKEHFVDELLEMNKQTNNWEQKRSSKIQGSYQPPQFIRAVKPDDKEL